MTDQDISEMYEEYMELYHWLCVRDEELHGEPLN